MMRHLQTTPRLWPPCSRRRREGVAGDYNVAPDAAIPTNNPKHGLIK